MRHLFITCGCLSLVLALLWIECLVMNKIRSAIPIRLVVVGTRGKTSVTRMIASGLREGGVRVLAKTTGSEARIVLPDGEELRIRRWGVNTPLEQRRILRLAARQRCDAIVMEAMSIRPESLRAELTQIIRPQTVVITNTYEDHIGDAGDPAAVCSLAIPSGATALVPADFPLRERTRLERRNVPYRVVEPNEEESLVERLAHPEWPQNLALALVVCETIGVSRELALQGMSHVRMDVGSLQAWLLRDGGSTAVWMAINAFAANDPRSTMAALERSLSRWPTSKGSVVGLLNLRSDRADRTAQWMKELDLSQDTFERLVVCGSVPMIAQRWLARRFGESVAVARTRDPRKIMAVATRLSPSGGHLFGFGNIGDVGIRLVEYWRQEGEPA